MYDEQPDGDPHGECAAEIQRLTGALENCRLYAARYRNEPWASVIRRFCFEGGATGSPLRSSTSEGPVESAQVAPAAAREKFEAYFAASRRNRGRERAEHLLDRLPDGTYALESTQRHWWTWQSALAAEPVKQQEKQGSPGYPIECTACGASPVPGDCPTCMLPDATQEKQGDLVRCLCALSNRLAQNKPLVTMPPDVGGGGAWYAVVGKDRLPLKYASKEAAQRAAETALAAPVKPEAAPAPTLQESYNKLFGAVARAGFVIRCHENEWRIEAATAQMRELAEGEGWHGDPPFGGFKTYEETHGKRLVCAPAQEEPAPVELTDEHERMAEALHRIKQWSEAYPLSVFHEPDFARAHEVLAAAGMTLDAISASNMRHVITEVQKIVDAALSRDR